MPISNLFRLETIFFSMSLTSSGILLIPFRILLNRYTPDIRITVKPDPNKIFTGLSQIRETQDKRNQRLLEVALPESQDAEEIVVKLGPKRKRPFEN